MNLWIFFAPKLLEVQKLPQSSPICCPTLELVSVVVTIATTVTCWHGSLFRTSVGWVVGVRHVFAKCGGNVYSLPPRELGEPPVVRDIINFKCYSLSSI